MLEVTPDLAIPEHELVLTASRSGGPGGQNVNKVSSKVTLAFDAAHSPSLTEAQRRNVLERLATRISKDGVLRVTSQRHRTQGANREAVLERFVELLRDALTEEAPRLPTRVSRAVRQRRLDEKRRHARLKRERTTVPDE